MESIYKSSDSASYLKKSELPKNVSAFKNDAGYISSTALDEWLRSHSYISKEEIQSLIASANLVVIDSVQESSDSEAIRRLEEYDNQLRGEIVEIKDRISDIETGSGFIPASKESSFATKEELNDVKSDVDDVKESIAQLESDSQNYLTEHQSLADYAKKSEIPSIPSMADYAKKSDVNAVKNMIPSVDGLASQEWVEDQNYLKEHQSLADYAKKSDIPSMKNYVKSSEMSKYALKENTYDTTYIDTTVNGLLPKTEASRTYALKTDVEKNYLTKKAAANRYLAIEDYIGIKDACTINTDYKEKPLAELLSNIDTLMNGFYLVNFTDIVIVKDKSMLSFFKDGVQHGLDGANGKSAYEVACDNGFDGSEDEWLDSLKGADGADGVMGIDGKSAYDVACDNGFDGSEDEWLDSLKGEDGTDGIDGVNGVNGKSAYEIAKDINPSLESEEEWLESLKGADGADGVDGQPGVNGKSAYEIAKDINPSLESEEEWLESLKGTDGEDGEDGSDGESAYEIAVRNGFEGDETAWLNSLKGHAILTWKTI